MNTEEERQDHLPTFATTTQSLSSTSQQDHPPNFPTTTKFVPSTSVLTSVHQIHTPPSCPSTPPPTPALFEGIQTRSRRRNQSLAPPLLEGIQTRSRQRKRSFASTPSASLGNGPAFRKKQKSLPELAMRLHELEVKHAQLLRDVKAFFKAYSQYRAAERAFQEFKRIRKTGIYSKAYSQQRLAELAIQGIQLTGEVEAYIKAYRQQHAVDQ